MCPPSRCCCCDLSRGVKVWAGVIIAYDVLVVVFVGILLSASLFPGGQQQQAAQDAQLARELESCRAEEEGHKSQLARYGNGLDYDSVPGDNSDYLERLQNQATEEGVRCAEIQRQLAGGEKVSQSGSSLSQSLDTCLANLQSLRSRIYEVQRIYEYRYMTQKLATTTARCEDLQRQIRQNEEDSADSDHFATVCVVLAILSVIQFGVDVFGLLSVNGTDGNALITYWKLTAGLIVCNMAARFIASIFPPGGASESFFYVMVGFACMPVATLWWVYAIRSVANEGPMADHITFTQYPTAPLPPESAQSEDGDRDRASDLNRRERELIEKEHELRKKEREFAKLKAKKSRRRDVLSTRDANPLAESLVPIEGTASLAESVIQPMAGEILSGAHADNQEDHLEEEAFGPNDYWLERYTNHSRNVSFCAVACIVVLYFFGDNAIGMLCFVVLLLSGCWLLRLQGLKPELVVNSDGFTYDPKRIDNLTCLGGVPPSSEYTWDQVATVRMLEVPGLLVASTQFDVWGCLCLLAKVGLDSQSSQRLVHADDYDKALGTKFVTQDLRGLAITFQAPKPQNRVLDIMQKTLKGTRGCLSQGLGLELSEYDVDLFITGFTPLNRKSVAQTMHVPCPEDVSGGSVIQVQTPGGTTLSVRVPEGIVAGESFSVQVTEPDTDRSMVRDAELLMESFSRFLRPEQILPAMRGTVQHRGCWNAWSNMVPLDWQLLGEYNVGRAVWQGYVLQPHRAVEAAQVDADGRVNATMHVQVGNTAPHAVDGTDVDVSTTNTSDTLIAVDSVTMSVNFQTDLPGGINADDGRTKNALVKLIVEVGAVGEEVAEDLERLSLDKLRKKAEEVGIPKAEIERAAQPETVTSL